MRLGTLNAAGELRPALWVDGEILDIRAAAEVVPLEGSDVISVRAIIESGAPALDALRRLEDDVRGTATGDRMRELGALVPEASAVLAAAIPDPGMVLAAGLNYRAHLEEMNTPVPGRPYAFTKSVASIVGSGEAIVLPRGYDTMVDWEGEFSVVIGRRAHDVSVRDALDYVAGYTIVNDVSARDWVDAVFAASGTMAAIAVWEENLLGKRFPTFCPLGPTILTADELPDPTDVRLQTRLNGAVMQDAHTGDLVFSVAELIAYYSRFYELRPGDVITTGSPAGVGVGRNPRVFMHAGDTIEVEIAGIGVLRNPIV